MKIAIVTPYADPEKGAAVIRVNTFRDYFKEKGCEVKIFAPKRAGVKNAKGVYRYNSVFELMKRIFAGNFDIVLGTSPPLTHNFFALVACKLSRKRFVLDAKDDPFIFEPLPSFFSLKGLKRRLYFLLRAITYKHADMLFFLTNWDRRLEIKRYNLDHKKCILVPNGSDPDIIYYSKDAREKTRKELNIPKDATVLIYAGSIGDEEIDKLIGAFDKLDRKNVFLLLVVSVEKANEWQLEKLLVKAKNRDRIKIVKNVLYEKMYCYLSAADIGIVPWPDKYYTSLPVKTFDYLFAGLFVIIKGPKKGALREFYRCYPWIGAYSTTWRDCIKKMKNTDRNMLMKIRRNNRIRAFIIQNFSRAKSLRFALDVFGGLLDNKNSLQTVARRF